MSTLASSNGRGSGAWCRPWTHLRIDRPRAGHCRVTFDHPPGNAITALTVAELGELVELIEHDADLRVVVFASADPASYLDDHDAAAAGSPVWPGLLARLSRAPVISVAAIRGRTRGAGCDFVLACDLRFAARETARLGPPGGAAARLSPLVGRARALEILLAADDLDAPRAELYGYVNRAIAGAALDAEVDAIAARLAELGREAIARAKAQVGAAQPNVNT